MVGILVRYSLTAKMSLTRSSGVWTSLGVNSALDAM